MDPSKSRKGVLEGIFTPLTMGTRSRTHMLGVWFTVRAFNTQFKLPFSFIKVVRSKTKQHFCYDFY